MLSEGTAVIPADIFSNVNEMVENVTLVQYNEATTGLSRTSTHKGDAMAKWVMISADFPGTTEDSEKRKRIYKCLEKKGFNKIPNVTTTWKKEVSAITESSGKISAVINRVAQRTFVKTAFIDCAKAERVTPTLVVMYGDSEPTEF